MFTQCMCLKTYDGTRTVLRGVPADSMDAWLVAFGLWRAGDDARFMRTRPNGMTFSVISNPYDYRLLVLDASRKMRQST